MMPQDASYLAKRQFKLLIKSGKVSNLQYHLTVLVLYLMIRSSSCSFQVCDQAFVQYSVPLKLERLHSFTKTFSTTILLNKNKKINLKNAK